MTATVSVLLADAVEALTGAGDSPRLEAELLLACALGKPRTFLHAWPEHSPTSRQIDCFTHLLARRRTGEPLAYLIGRREFWSLDLVVTPAVLIPRPASERLVELALERIVADRPLRIADLGTGSGALALAIARERPACRIVATDISRAALAVARLNARRLGCPNVAFRRGDWYTPLAGARFDLIVANPPYIAAADPHLGRGDLPFEPKAALVAGPDGLEALRTIIDRAPDYLHPGGWLLVEHGYDQGERVTALLRARGFRRVADYRDAEGIGRVACGGWLGAGR